MPGWGSGYIHNTFRAGQFDRFCFFSEFLRLLKIQQGQLI
jgi:hypothetical protein